MTIRILKSVKFEVPVIMLEFGYGWEPGKTPMIDFEYGILQLHFKIGV